jgi:hypothetical protein
MAEMPFIEEKWDGTSSNSSSSSPNSEHHRRMELDLMRRVGIAARRACRVEVLPLVVGVVMMIVMSMTSVHSGELMVNGIGVGALQMGDWAASDARQRTLAVVVGDGSSVSKREKTTEKVVHSGAPAGTALETVVDGKATVMAPRTRRRYTEATEATK